MNRARPMAARLIIAIIANGAPYLYGKETETPELIYSWLSWLVILLVGAYDSNDDNEVSQHGGLTPA